jgi:hypothetical protein
MKRISLIAALLGATIFAFAGSAIAAPGATGNVNCTDNSLAGKVINSNVTVPAGATCDLSWSDIKGNVSIAGTLTTYGMTTFEKNVSVVGGSFGAANWGVTIDGNLSFLNPATYSYNGFWGNQGGSTNLVKGNLSYTITSDTVYPMYQSPLLYFGGGTTVDGNFSYSDQGTGFPGHLDQGGLNVLGQTSIS